MFLCVAVEGFDNRIDVGRGALGRFVKQRQFEWIRSKKRPIRGAKSPFLADHRCAPLRRGASPHRHRRAKLVYELTMA
jgi:hypothetical protein